MNYHIKNIVLMCALVSMQAGAMHLSPLSATTSMQFKIHDEDIKKVQNKLTELINNDTAFKRCEQQSKLTDSSYDEDTKFKLVRAIMEPFLQEQQIVLIYNPYKKYLKDNILPATAQDQNAQYLRLYFLKLMNESETADVKEYKINDFVPVMCLSQKNCIKNQQQAASWSAWFKRCSVSSLLSACVGGLYYYYRAYSGQSLQAAQGPMPMVKTMAVVSALTACGGLGCYFKLSKTQDILKSLQKGYEQQKLRFALAIGINKLNEIAGFNTLDLPTEPVTE